MGTKFVKPENYIVIQGFMLTDLHLKSTELLVYAVIYGFCQTEQQYFTGDLKYLAEWTNCTVRGVSKCLKSLTEKNLISDICDENGKRCGYTILATQEQSSANIGTKFREDRNKVPTQQEQSSIKQEQSSIKQEQSSEKQEQSSAHNNINNIIYNNYNNNNIRTCASDVYTRYENLIGNLISENIVNSIDTYIAEGIEPEMIIAAIDDAEAANVRRWSYVNKILLDKLSKNIKTLREYNLDKQQFEQSRIKRQNNGTPPPCDAFLADSGGSESYYIPDPEEKARYLKLYGGDTL